MSRPLPQDLVTAIERAAAVKTLVVASDFDGVLAPFVEDPMRARALPGTIEALRALQTRPGTTAAIVSGRDLSTLESLTQATDLVLIGSHGGQASLEGITPEEFPDDELLMDQVHAALSEVVARHPGARLEEKVGALAVHTRGLPTAVADSALAEALSVGGSLTGARVRSGKSVIEVSVLHADKGSALLRLASLVNADAVVYFGDDVTDEDAFVALTGPSDVTVKVGEGTTSARYRISDGTQVCDALALLVTRRTAAVEERTTSSG